MYFDDMDKGLMAMMYLFYGIIGLFFALFGKSPRQEIQTFSILHPDTTVRQPYPQEYRYVAGALSFLYFSMALGYWGKPHHVGILALIPATIMLLLSALGAKRFYEKGTGWKNVLKASSVLAMGLVFWVTVLVKR
jgi:hypothetical protein